MSRLGIYVHFPYCLRRCPYCDFTAYQVARQEVPHERYADALVAELRSRVASGRFEGLEPVSVFFGGGTPSLWKPDSLGRVLEEIRRVLHVSAPLEVTVECNPSSLDAETARALFRAGVNRLSIGVQSLRQRHLSLLGRLHDAAGALASLEAATSTVRRVSADFIYGMPNHDVPELEEDLCTAVAAGVEHVSLYALTIEPHTMFGQLAHKGELSAMDDDASAALYEAAATVLGSKGFEHYEISNWARPGAHALHNRLYWEGEPYMGLGVGAFGFYREREEGIRYRNTRDPSRYLAQDPEDDWSEALTADDLVNERMLMGLRLVEGIDTSAAAELLARDVVRPRRRAIERLERDGLLAFDGRWLRIPERHWLLADYVIRMLIL